MIELLRLIRIHPLFWVVIAVGVGTGHFRELVMLFVIVFLHELGHASAAHVFRWRIRKIELLPFGGVAETEEYGNRPFREEFIVILAGPFQHLLLFVVSYVAFLFLPFWSASDHQLFLFHNLTLLLFNLLPIWPLDGGKILLLLTSKLWPYRNAQKWALRISMGLLAVSITITFFYFPLHLQWWLIIGFIILSHYIEWRQQPYGFVRFLLERQRMQPIWTKKSIIQTISGRESVHEALRKLYKCRHTVYKIKETGKYMTETELLDYWLRSNQAKIPVGKIIK